MLRYAHDMKNDTWKKLVDNNSVSVSAVNGNEGNLGAEKCPGVYSILKDGKSIGAYNLSNVIAAF
jgi:hypothetical protein